MMVELQIDSDAFCKSFREQTRKALACRLTEDSLDFDPSDSVPGTPFVITSYTVGDTTLRRAQEKANVCIHIGDPAVTTFRQVNRAQIVQMIVAHVAWVSDLRVANTAKTATTAIHLPVVFEMTIETCTNMRVLCFHFVGLDGMSENPISQKLQQTIQGACTWLPVEQVLAEYMPEEIKLVNSHCTLAQSGRCIVVRMEFWDEAWGAASGDPARQVPEWEQFYTGHIDDRLTRGQERDGWSIFLDQFALTNYVRQTIIDSLKDKKDLSITRQPVTTWDPGSPNAPVPASHVHVSLEVEQKDACYCLTEDTDVAAEVTADVFITVPAENTLRIDIYMAVTPNVWDASCCVATVALFWPIMGPGQYAQGKIPPDDFALTLLPLVAVLGAVMKLDKATSDLGDPPSGFVKDPTNNLHLIQEQKLVLPNASFGRMTLKGSKPLSDTTSLKANGLYLYGALDSIVLPYPELEDPVLEPFCWGKGGRCSRRVTASTRFRLNPVNPQHWALLQVCQVRVIDDPLNIFQVEVQRDEHSLPDVIVHVDFWNMKAEYWEPPHLYPCRLMVKTTGGVRILTLPPLPSLTKEQFDSLYLGLQLEYVNNCYLPRHRIFEELEWPIEVLIEHPGLHHWQVRAVGMEPGERVQLVDRRGNVVARFMASRNGTLVVNALGRIEAPSASGERQVRSIEPVLSLRRAQGGRTTLMSGPPMQTMDQRGPFDGGIPPATLLGPASTEPICGPAASGGPNDMIRIRKTPYTDEILAPKNSSREVIVRQTFLEDQGYIRLSGECLAVAADSAEGHARVVAVTPGLVEAFDVSDARSPRRTGAWRASGVRGAIAFGGKLLLWGDPGIWSAGGSPTAVAPFERCSKAAVRSVAAIGDRLFVLGNGELIVYGPDLCEQARYECRAEQIAVAGNSIVLRDAEGVRFFDGQRGSLENAVFHPICGTSHIETPAIAFGKAIYVRGPKGGLILTDSGECLAEYEGAAWFEGVARTGRRLAFRDGRVVRLLQAVRSVQSE